MRDLGLFNCILFCHVWLLSLGGSYFLKKIQSVSRSGGERKGKRRTGRIGGGSSVMDKLYERMYFQLNV